MTLALLEGRSGESTERRGPEVEAVARVYETELGNIGVSISYSKSFLSYSGSAEFAKRCLESGILQWIFLLSIGSRSLIV